MEFPVIDKNWMRELGVQNENEMLSLLVDVLCGKTLAIQRGAFTITSAGRENYVSVLLDGAELYSVEIKDGEVIFLRNSKQEIRDVWHQKYGTAEQS